ncbi:MAG: hypothetical protein M1816_004506 [Peltula sp. TS41687]|nr:MAG: hypothetical protein M1816_004506 [Peltula sp. TS41687]
MSGSGTRIPEAAFKSVLGGLFGIAMISAAARTTLRLKQHGRLFLDDLFLFIACVFLTTSTIITYQVSTDLYVPYSEFVSFHPDELHRRVVWFQKMVFSFIATTWVVIFAVKLSFMYFFRALVDRLTNMILYWRIVLGIMAVSFGFCVSEAAIECPHFDISSVQCVLGPKINKTLGVMIATISLDFITDLLMVAIPIRLLWKVRMKRKQKFGLGAFLCLSVLMVITAIVRVSALRTRVVILGLSMDAIDMTWKHFWQQAEASIAVATISFTAFRSFFVADASRYRRAPPAKPSYSFRQRIWNRKRSTTSQTESGAGRLPSIPSATITGLRTFISGGGGFGAGGGAGGGIKTMTSVVSKVDGPASISQSEIESTQEEV